MSTLLNFSEDIFTNNISHFLNTQQLAKIQGSNINNFYMFRSLVLLRRLHSLKRIFPHFENFIFNCWDDKEHIILINIKNKLISIGYVGANYDFGDSIDPNSLVDFNRSIEWLDGYALDLEFINLLAQGENTNYWSIEEIPYINNWKKEFGEIYLE